jgi:hypothetical protein
VDPKWGTTVATIYYSATLANTVISTILIIIRVLFLTGPSGAIRRIRLYRRVLEAIVESAALYSIVLLVYVPFVSNTSDSAGPDTLMIQSVLIPMTVR